LNTKTKIAAISTILTLILGGTMILLPIASAHDPPWTIKTWAYISVAPNPIGVGQSAYVTMWLDKVPPMSTGPYGPRWHDFTVEVTKPDGTTETLGPYDSDSVGGAWDQYTPDQTGTYQFDFTFPGQIIEIENPAPGGAPFGSDIFVNDTYSASSASTTLTVTEEEVERQYEAAPLPTEYWERPISSMNREWASIAGNWLGLRSTYFGYSGVYDASGNFNPYTTAPNSSHVIWTQPMGFGGQIGGEHGESETSLYHTGTAYEGKFNPVIMQGILYYTDYPGAAPNRGDLKALDIRTGEELWSIGMNDTYDTLRCGMIYNFETGDQYGGKPYLFTTNTGHRGFLMSSNPPVWSMYEPSTGHWILDIANPAAGTLATGPKGELLSYAVRGGMLTMWNASKCIITASGAGRGWRPPPGATIDWSLGNEWSVPIATDISGVPISPALSPIAFSVDDDVILMTSQDTSVPGWFQTGWRVDAGYSAVDGQLLWGPVNRTVTPWIAEGNNVITGEGIYAVYERETMVWKGFDIKTGSKLWTTESKNSTWGYYDVYGTGVIGYGNLYSWGMGGEAYCYDIETGEEKWSWNAGNSGLDTPYGVWPLGSFRDSYLLADGKLYVRSGHDYTPPVFKGAKLYCIDAYTGDEIWSSLSFNIVGTPAIADGYMLWFNGYDNQIYCYGKGLTKTSTTASPKVSVHGSNVLVEGTVTDESPGAKTSLLTSRFPNGVPAISDDDQSAWMEYLYQQQPRPTDAEGVEVIISVFDPNGNYYDVATATSDAEGYFGTTFTPVVPGTYTVIAQFAGSDSYYGSVAETFINVEEAPAETAPPTPTPAPMTDAYVLGLGAGSIVAIVAIGLVIILMLRKR
jgi:outer membrane protein assembly factor BamB